MSNEKSAFEYESEIRRLQNHILKKEDLDIFDLQAIANFYADDQISSGKFRELAKDWLTGSKVQLPFPNEKDYVRNIKYDVEQISYSYWGDPNAPKDYFSQVDRIAYVIGLMLSDMSTIWVSQTKEKFGQPRVYVDIAAYEKVHDKWKSLGNKGKPDDEFFQACRASDMKHYNYCYRVAYELFPQYRKIISEGADYTEWTFCSTYEWDMWCDWQMRYNPKYREDHQYDYDLLYEPLKKFEGK